MTGVGSRQRSRVRRHRPASSCESTRETCIGDHGPRFSGVGMRLSFQPEEGLPSEVAPLARSSSITGSSDRRRAASTSPCARPLSEFVRRPGSSGSRAGRRSAWRRCDVSWLGSELAWWHLLRCGGETCANKSVLASARQEQARVCRRANLKYARANLKKRAFTQAIYWQNLRA